MKLTPNHCKFLIDAISEALKDTTEGSMAYIDCLKPEIMEQLASDTENFKLNGFEIYLVSDKTDDTKRTITADLAVEMREEKRKSVLLLVDKNKAGAGMDGIYSAVKELDEKSFLKEAASKAENYVKKLNHNYYIFAKEAIKKAKELDKISLNNWNIFNFWINIIETSVHPFELLYLIGLWPIKPNNYSSRDDLIISRIFVERLLMFNTSSTTIHQRIQTLRLINPIDEIKKLEEFLYENQYNPRNITLNNLADKPHLWVNELKIESSLEEIISIKLIPWYKNGKYQKWSGLEEREDNPPVFRINLEETSVKKYSKLKVRWESSPSKLKKGSVEYVVKVLTIDEEPISEKYESHKEKPFQECTFDNEDFKDKEESGDFYAKIEISVLNNDNVEKVTTEDFLVQFTQDYEASGTKAEGSTGKSYRTFVDGLIELEDRQVIKDYGLADDFPLEVDSKGFILWKKTPNKKIYKVFRPALIKEIDEKWIEQDKFIGRWELKISTTGFNTACTNYSSLRYIPIDIPKPAKDSNDKKKVDELWSKLNKRSRELAKIVNKRSSVGLIIDKDSPNYKIVKEYINLYNQLLSSTKSDLALANTVEVKDSKGTTIGLIVLPIHFMRLAWQSAYDNLVLSARFDISARFDENIKPQIILKEFKSLEASYFPALLPNPASNGAFVFYDNIGFHSAGMVLDTDKEANHSIALLAAALGENEDIINSRTLSKTSAELIAQEIKKFIEIHPKNQIIKINAINPGDGLTIAYALQKTFNDFEMKENNQEQIAPLFQLYLYSLNSKYSLLGKYLSDIQQKRRSAPTSLKDEEASLFHSIKLNEVEIPKLRWYKKYNNPSYAQSSTSSEINTNAHLTIGFDLFNTKLNFVKSIKNNEATSGCGLIAYFNREYSIYPYSNWTSYLPIQSEFDKNLNNHEEISLLINSQKCLIENLSLFYDQQGLIPVLQTKIDDDYKNTLKTFDNLHQLSNWVITVDRNLALEYFDSPKEDESTYSKFVIDCITDSKGVGNIQLITSTSCIDEVLNIFDFPMSQLGLIRTRRNVEFILDNLKRISNRLAIRLTGTKSPSNELIALALATANCLKEEVDNEIWFPLNQGFFIPLVDVAESLTFSVNDNDTPNYNAFTKPDLIYVTLDSNENKLLFRFAKIYFNINNSYDVRSSLKYIAYHVSDYEKHWLDYYSINIFNLFRSIRLAKLARILRFYLQKAYRHYLLEEVYWKLNQAINEMVINSDYEFAPNYDGNRIWIFSPEHNSVNPVQINIDAEDLKVYRFGPHVLPDNYINEDDYLISVPPKVYPKVYEDKPINTEVNDNNSDKKKVIAQYDVNDSKSNHIETNNTSTASDNIVYSVNLGTSVSGDDVYFDISVQGNPHLLIIGLSGMGKTHSLRNMCKQLIDKNVYPVIFSYHPDLKEMIASCCENIHFIKSNVLSFNPLHVYKTKDPRSYLDVASRIKEILSAVFPDLRDLQKIAIFNAVEKSFTDLGWNQNEVENFDKLPIPKFESFYNNLKANPNPEANIKNLIARLVILEKYSLFKCDDKNIDFWSINKPIIIELEDIQNEKVQNFLTYLVLYHMYKTMSIKGTSNRITHVIVLDEAHRAAELELLPTMVKESRKFGISFLLASQGFQDFNKSVYDAVANFLCLQVNDNNARKISQLLCNSKEVDYYRDKLKSLDKFRGILFSGKRKPTEIRLKE